MRSSMIYILLLLTSSCGFNNNAKSKPKEVKSTNEQNSLVLQVNYSDSIVDSVWFDFNDNDVIDKITIYGDNHIPLGDGPEFPRKMTFEMDNKLVWENDSIVLCTQCGGANGDPFAQILLENDTLKMYHYGGSGWRWGIDQFFVYEKNSNKFSLVFEQHFNFHAGDHEETYEKKITPINKLQGVYLNEINNYH